MFGASVFASSSASSLVKGPRSSRVRHRAGSVCASESANDVALRDGRAASANLKALPGPLAQLGLGRDGAYFVIAAGRAIHAGLGKFKGIVTGNSSFIGIEAEKLD